MKSLVAIGILTATLGIVACGKDGGGGGGDSSSGSRTRSSCMRDPRLEQDIDGNFYDIYTHKKVKCKVSKKSCFDPKYDFYDNGEYWVDHKGKKVDCDDSEYALYAEDYYDDLSIGGRRSRLDRIGRRGTRARIYSDYDIDRRGRRYSRSLLSRGSRYGRYYDEFRDRRLGRRISSRRDCLGRTIIAGGAVYCIESSYFTGVYSNIGLESDLYACRHGFDCDNVCGTRAKSWGPFVGWISFCSF